MFEDSIPYKKQTVITLIFQIGQPAIRESLPGLELCQVDAEWTKLENYLIANGYNYDGTTTGNKIAKSMAATTYWNSYANAGAIGNILPANNSSGFSALPGGYRGNEGSFFNIGNTGVWWSSLRGAMRTPPGVGLWSSPTTIFSGSHIP